MRSLIESLEARQLFDATYTVALGESINVAQVAAVESVTLTANVTINMATTGQVDGGKTTVKQTSKFGVLVNGTPFLFSKTRTVAFINPFDGVYQSAATKSTQTLSVSYTMTAAEAARFVGVGTVDLAGYALQQATISKEGVVLGGVASQMSITGSVTVKVDEPEPVVVTTVEELTKGQAKKAQRVEARQLMESR